MCLWTAGIGVGWDGMSEAVNRAGWWWGGWLFQAGRCWRECEAYKDNINNYILKRTSETNQNGEKDKLTTELLLFTVLQSVQSCYNLFQVVL